MARQQREAVGDDAAGKGKGDGKGKVEAKGSGAKTETTARSEKMELTDFAPELMLTLQSTAQHIKGGTMCVGWLSGSQFVALLNAV